MTNVLGCSHFKVNKDRNILKCGYYLHHWFVILGLSLKPLGRGQSMWKQDKKDNEQKNKLSVYKFCQFWSFQIPKSMIYTNYFYLNILEWYLIQLLFNLSRGKKKTCKILGDRVIFTKVCSKLVTTGWPTPQTHVLQDQKDFLSIDIKYKLCWI